MDERSGGDGRLPRSLHSPDGQTIQQCQQRGDTYADASRKIHPAQALRQYRSEFISDAKAVVVGMTSNGFTLADPNDRGMMDVVGFDTTAPAVIADFVRE